MARAIRKSGVREVPLSEFADDLSRFLRETESEEIVITRRGKPVGAPIGFAAGDDGIEDRLKNDPRFLPGAQLDRQRRGKFRHHPVADRQPFRLLRRQPILDAVRSRLPGQGGNECRGVEIEHQ